jgi:hypothetical protein
MKTQQFLSGGYASAPTSATATSAGYPTNGNPGGGVPATAVGDFWFHKIESELGAIIDAAGLTQSDSDLTQLLQSIHRLFASPVGASVNYLASNNVSTPNTKMDISADEIVLKNATSMPLLATALSATVDIAASGLNGLDTGSKANSTWYALWVISNGTTTGGLLSLSFTAPTLPSGYTYKALKSAVRVNSSGNFIKINQYQNEVGTERQNALSNGQAATINVYESLSLAAFVPPNARFVGAICGSNSGSAGNGYFKLASSPLGGGLGQNGANQMYFGSANSLSPGMNSESSIRAMLFTSQTIYWTQSDRTVASAQMDITGWEF